MNTNLTQATITHLLLIRILFIFLEIFFKCAIFKGNVVKLYFENAFVLSLKIIVMFVESSILNKLLVVFSNNVLLGVNCIQPGVSGARFMLMPSL